VGWMGDALGYMSGHGAARNLQVIRSWSCLDAYCVGVLAVVGLSPLDTILHSESDSMHAKSSFSLMII
jgi:hypothetical protein